MKNTQKWILGTALTVASLLALPFAWGMLFPYDRYGTMGYGYGWHMPMMYQGYAPMGFGMLFMWLISVASLVLMGLGIAWLIKALSAQNKP
jgi:hypothetical protein